jgi:crotonobetainyl-CoA:carnitine CoA-transferase CaiB-like acyl-CoA transferase
MGQYGVDAGGPLGGVRVIDLTDLRGAMCSRILADLGADVLRVEAPATTDVDRSVTAYRYRNANKRATVLDLHDEAGRAALDILLASADVLIENLGPTRHREHGLDPSEVAQRHPHLVHAALTDLGLDGPRAHWHLEPLPALASTGGLFSTGFPQLPPNWLPGYLAHDCASVYAAAGVVAALLARDESGLGQRVEVSAQEAGLAGLTPWSVALEDYVKVSPLLPFKGTRNADGAYWVLPARDGWIRSVIGTPRQWHGFVALLGHPDALIGEAWEAHGFRLMNLDVIRMVAEDSLRDRTRAQLFAESLALGTTVGVLHTPSEFVAHEQTAHREFFAATGYPGLGDAPFATAPYRLAATPASLRGPAPQASTLVSADAGFAPRSAGERVTPAPSGAASGAASAPPLGRAPRQGTGLLLDGVRVVEFGMAAVVPEMCGVLSELGAEVIKVESMQHPDVLRTTGAGGINRNFTFNAESRGRESVTIDASTNEGRALALALCAQADIVAENYRGGVLDRLGLGYDQVQRVNPDVIYVSSQGYGRGGPFGEMPAFGPLNAGFAGLHHRWSSPDGPYPCGTSMNHPDHIAGKLLAVAVLAALRHRSHTGAGQYLDMAQTEAAAYLLGEMYLDGALTGIEPGSVGNSSDHHVPHGVYPAAGDDRWVAIAVSDDDAFARFGGALGWGDDPSLATLPDRLARRDELDKRVSAWTETLDPADAAAQLQAVGVSAMAVMGPADHHADEHLAARQFIVTLEHPEVGTERHVGNPIRLSRTPQRTAASAPCLGADTIAVLHRVLGLAPHEVEALTDSGVCR